MSSAYRTWIFPAVPFVYTSISRTMNLILPPQIGFPFHRHVYFNCFIAVMENLFPKLWSQVQMVEIVVSQPTWEAEAVCSCWRRKWAG